MSRQDRVAVITGAGSGIDWAVALALAGPTRHYGAVADPQLIPPRPTEWFMEEPLLSYRGGTAPAFHRLPCFAVAGTRSGSFSCQSRSPFTPRARHQ
jgi:hypothetical protein